MRSILKAAAILCLVTAGTLPAKDLPKSELTVVAPDPKAVALIQELQLPEAPQAQRDQRGWKPPKRIVLSGAGFYNAADPNSLAAWQAAAPGVDAPRCCGTATQMTSAAAAATAAGTSHPARTRRLQARPAVAATPSGEIRARVASIA